MDGQQVPIRERVKTKEADSEKALDYMEKALQQYYQDRSIFDVTTFNDSVRHAARLYRVTGQEKKIDDFIEDLERHDAGIGIIDEIKEYKEES